MGVPGRGNLPREQRESILGKLAAEDPDAADYNARIGAQDNAVDIARSPGKTGNMTRSDLVKMTSNSLPMADPDLVAKIKAEGVTEPIKIQQKRSGNNTGGEISVYGDNYGVTGEFTIDDYRSMQVLAAAKQAGISDIPVQVVGKIPDSIPPESMGPYARMHSKDTGKIKE